MRSYSFNRKAACTAVLFTLVFSTACAKRSSAEVTLERYVTAIYERRCDDAKALLSEQTLRGLEKLRARPLRPNAPSAPEEYYCSKFAFEHCQLSKMELKEVSGDKAIISMPCGRTQDSMFPGFTSIFLKYEPHSVELIRESGNWFVKEPLVLRYAELREKEDLEYQRAMENHRRYDAEQRNRRDQVSTRPVR
jgi:hypothetical protein